MKWNFLPYFRLQIKRELYYAPSVLLVSVLLLCALAVFTMSAADSHDGEEARQEINIGVVGNSEDPWFQLGFTALEQLDPSKYAVSYFKMDEDEAIRMMKSGKLMAYLVIPDGFVEAMQRGESRTIRYVSTEGAVDVGTLLVDESVRSIASLLEYAGGTIQKVRDYVGLYLPDVDQWATADDQTEIYLSLILRRNELFDREIAGIVGGQSFQEYYFCSVMLIYLMGWGIACAPMFFSGSKRLRSSLSMAGVSSGTQLIAEYLSYCAFLLLFFLGLLALCTAALSWFPALSTALQISPRVLWRYTVRAAVPAVMFAALHMLVFELSSDVVSALLALFLITMGMSYLAGCFYPASFLPEAFRRIGELLPAGVAFQWVRAPGVLSGAGIAFYGVLFLLIGWLLRRKAGAQ